MNTQQVNDKFMAGLTPPVTPMPKDNRKHADVSSASTKDRVSIRVNESERPEDNNEVLVGVNGRAYQIKRGVEVAVPPEVVHALENAVIDKAIPQFTDNGMPNGFILRPTRRFPFEFVNAEAHLKYKAWLQQSLDLRDAQIKAQQEADEAAYG